MALEVLEGAMVAIVEVMALEVLEGGRMGGMEDMDTHLLP